MPCHAMHPIQDLFLESFSYVLQFDMHFYMHSYLHKIFILVKSGCYSQLIAAEEDLKNQRQLLKSAWKTSSMRKTSFKVMISSAVAHAAAPFKNHLPDLNMELLRQDFTVDDAERETLVSSAFDAAQDFVSSYDFTSLAESNDNDSPKAL